MSKRKVKRPITLLEIMIVIFLIGIIGSVVGYNVKGSLDEGRAFKSEQGAAQIRDILLLEVAKGISAEDVVAHKEQYLAASGLVKNVSKLLKDGWGQEYKISAVRSNTDISVFSERLKAYKTQKKKKLGDQSEEDDDMNDDS